MIDQIFGALLTNVLTSAIGRGFTGLLRYEGEHRKILKVLKGKGAPPELDVSKSVDRLKIVIGSGLGEYTEGVQSVLEDVVRDGALSTLLYGAATFQRSRDTAISHIDKLYGPRLKASGIDPIAFAEALVEAVKMSVYAKYGEPALAELMAANGALISSKLDGISAALSEGRRFALTPEKYSEVRTKVAKALLLSTKTIGIETTKAQKRVAISTYFVRSRLRVMGAEDFLGEVVSPVDVNEESVLSLNQFAAIFHRAVVVGDPGGGKSTLCQYLCHEFCQRTLAFDKHTGHEGHDFAFVKVPIVVVLRRFEKSHEANGTSLIDFVAQELSSEISENKETIERWLRESLGRGQVTMVFDGLDEIMDVASRRRYVKMVESFADTWPATPILSTTRKVGYSKAPLSEEYTAFELAPFNETEVLQYANKLIAIEKSLNKDKAGELARTFYTQTSRNAGDLRRNPLMLGLMVWLFCAHGEVPSHRAEIYKQCAELMFERWDKNRGIKANIPEDFDLISLFCFLANEIFGSARLEEGVTAEWLESALFKFFKKWYEENAKAKLASRLMQEFITGRAWVMTDVGAGIYKFTHRTFLEYFFSRYILSSHDTAKSLVHVLRAKITNAQWDVINHLCIQAFCYKDARRGTDVANLLIEIVDKVGGERRENALIFFARTMEYLVLSEADTRRLASRAIRAAFVLAGMGRRGALVVVDLLFAAHVDRHPILTAELDKVVSECLRQSSGDDKVTKELLLFLSGRFRQVFFAHRFVGSDSVRIRDRLVEKFRKEIIAVGRRNVGMAELVIQTVPTAMEEMRGRFGDSLLICLHRDRLADQGIELPPLIEGLLTIGEDAFRHGREDERSELFVAVAKKYIETVVAGAGTMRIPAAEVPSLEYTEAGIVRHLANGLYDFKGDGLFGRLVMLFVCKEVHQLYRLKIESGVLPIAARVLKKRVRMTIEASSPGARKLLEQWSDGTFSTVEVI